MLEWIVKNEGYVISSAILLGGVILLLILGLSARRQQRFRMQVTDTLAQIQQQQDQIQQKQMQVQQEQGLLHDQQTLFRSTFEQQTKTLRDQMSTELLHTQQEVTTLSKALRTTKVQGAWGELELLNCLTLIGMEEIVDFEAQKSFPTLDRQQRPDVIVRIPPDRCVAIDVKNPLESY